MSWLGWHVRMASLGSAFAGGAFCCRPIFWEPSHLHLNTDFTDLNSSPTQSKNHVTDAKKVVEKPLPVSIHHLGTLPDPTESTSRRPRHSDLVEKTRHRREKRDRKPLSVWVRHLGIGGNQKAVMLTRTEPPRTRTRTRTRPTRTRTRTRTKPSRTRTRTRTWNRSLRTP